MNMNTIDRFDKLIIVMRHGERQDDTSIENDNDNNMNDLINECDPDLTKRGEEQAISIGQQLAKLIPILIESNKSLDQIRIKIETSPFSRTIMTSKNVKEGLNANKSKLKIEINNALYEYLSKSLFKLHPADFLKVSKQNLDCNNNIFIKGDSPQYPESLADCINRYERCLRKFKEDLISSNNDNECDVLIIVTHGYGVQVISEALNIDQEWFIVDYCYTFVFGIDGDGKSKYLYNLIPIIN